jgi:cell division protein FtsL
MNTRMTQAYQQTPWRIQTQWIGLFLLALLLIASVAGVYLSISASSTKTGRQIQSLEYQIEKEKQGIADLNTELAFLTSSAQMEKRAAEMGFQLEDPSSITYLVVPGYEPKDTPQLASQPGPVVTSPTMVQSDYTESLWDWLAQFIATSLNGEG